MNMKLSRALKTKNRLVERLSKARTAVRSCNSFTTDDVIPYDAAEKMVEAATTEKDLVVLKTAISRANAPVVDLIYRQAELRDRVVWLKTIPVKEGVEKTRWAGEIMEKAWKTTISQEKLDALVLAAEEEIDQLQASLDQHNATVSVTVDLESI